MDENNDNVFRDSTESLLIEYDRKKHSRPDDSAAMQALLCILLCAVLFAGSIYLPEETEALMEKVRRLAFSEKELMINPIDLVLALLK